MTVLQKNFGITYNADLIDRDDFFVDSRNLFIHGILETKQGTCSSLPPFYLAIGSRLGYPLKLVATKSHLFLRWEDAKDRFNIECTVAKGLVCHPDDHYRQWPFPVSDKEAKAYKLLVSKTRREEVAAYLAARGHCFHDNGNLREATQAYSWAAELDDHDLSRAQLSSVLQEWRGQLDKVWPPGFPELTLTFPRNHLQFRDVPRRLEHGIIHLETMDDLFKDKALDRRWWQPMRQGITPHDLPKAMTVDYDTRTDYKIQFHHAKQG